jgi:antirestriction protein ArdC
MQAENLYESVTAKIVAELENGTVPWVKPWKGGNTGGIMPINSATHRHYSGINVLILWAIRDEHGYPMPEWMTFKQAKEKGASIRKGEKGTAVVFAKPLTINESEDERTIFVHKIFYVFNVAQIDGLP